MEFVRRIIYLLPGIRKTRNDVHIFICSQQRLSDTAAHGGPAVPPFCRIQSIHPHKHCYVQMGTVLCRKCTSCHPCGHHHCRHHCRYTSFQSLFHFFLLSSAAAFVFHQYHKISELQGSPLPFGLLFCCNGFIRNSLKVSAYGNKLIGLFVTVPDYLTPALKPFRAATI